MSELPKDLSFDALELWWTMLLHRTLELSPALPKHLRGSIQFEAITRTGAKKHFHLRLNGSDTQGREGVHQPFDTLVCTTEDEIVQLLLGEVVPKDALKAAGDTALFRSWLKFLYEHKAPRRLLELRGQL